MKGREEIKDTEEDINRVSGILASGQVPSLHRVHFHWLRALSNYKTRPKQSDSFVSGDDRLTIRSVVSVLPIGISNSLGRDTENYSFLEKIKWRDAWTKKRNTNVQPCSLHALYQGYPDPSQCPLFYLIRKRNGVVSFDTSSWKGKMKLSRDSRRYSVIRNSMNSNNQHGYRAVLRGIEKDISHAR